jgi:hypothetical protein
LRGDGATMGATLMQSFIARLAGGTDRQVGAIGSYVFTGAN